ncbi:hypothetical protein QLX08_009340 [Tetragonisca angustula]|uniref:Uncharacterized protein n=1 Tax=Tetragonisca angustula TaxID=166442 RepID=A0AAW0ZIW6_9HYME
MVEQIDRHAPPESSKRVPSFPDGNTKIQATQHKELKKHKKEYSTIRNKYIAHIRKTKKDSWRKFVTDTGNQDPWSIIYKIQTKKLKIENVQQTIKLSGEQTASWNETMEAMLQSLIPSDTTDNETRWQKEIRLRTETSPDSEDTPPFTTAETEKAVRILGNKKAPRHDLVEPEMVKQAWPVMQKEFNDMFNKCLQDCTFPRQ